MFLMVLHFIHGKRSITCAYLSLLLPIGPLLMCFALLMADGADMNVEGCHLLNFTFVEMLLN